MTAGRPVTRQGLDQSLANIASGLREYLSEGSDASRLANWLNTTSQETLEAPLPQADTDPEGYGYTTDEAFAIKLYGDYLTQVIAAWNGAALPALSPSCAEHGATFTGLD